MKYFSRAYQSKNDLYETGLLIRRIYSRDRYFNAWSFCRFDIWAQRRIADMESFNAPEWQQNFRLWHDETGNLVAVVSNTIIRFVSIY